MERCPDHMATPIAKPATCEVCDMEMVRTLRAQVQGLEDAEENWKAIIADERAENIKLFRLLGVMPEVEAGRAGTDAVVAAVQRLQAKLATAQDGLKEKQRALKAIRGLLVVRPHRFADQSEKIHAVLDDALGQ